MKATELRIGNLVEAKAPQMVTTIESLNRDFDGNLYVDVNPIPLTEEWLLKLGFQKDEDGYPCIDSGRKWFAISIKEHSILYRPDIGLKVIELAVYLEHIHQLQNLHFALTNEELICKKQ